MALNDPLISTDWLSEHLDDPTVVVLDASWHMPNAGRNAALEFTAEHIPGASFFDIDEVSDHSNPLPHMLPDPSDFAIAARRLGISARSRIVVYDTVGLFSAPRAWWMFRAMGHDDVHVLSGGLPRWIAEGRAVETGWRAPEHGDFKSHPVPEMVVSLKNVAAALVESSWQIVDARPAPRYLGAVPEPRPGLRSGHMPGALSLPASNLVENGSLAPAIQLRSAFDNSGVDMGLPTIATCGSGISAATIALALARLGRWDTAIYDGSWTEWGGRTDMPVVTGH